jgi:hypothetical protein
VEFVLLIVPAVDDNDYDDDNDDDGFGVINGMED